MRCANETEKDYATAAVCVPCVQCVSRVCERQWTSVVFSNGEENFFPRVDEAQKSHQTMTNMANKKPVIGSEI
jgi:hypothetical protein